jgi:UDP-2,3-diacylglucosamine hydrolase
MAVVSDLHLAGDTPATVAAFCRLCSVLPNHGCDALLILGDLFEVWIGDDQAPDDATLSVVSSLANLGVSGVFCAFMRGNRDFLVGAGFARRAGLRLLPDPCVVEFQGHALLLSHGDAWCSADRPYQNFRRTVRSAQWQRDFLARPLAERAAIARAIRQASEAGKSQRGYVDVDARTVLRAARRHAAPVVIHGHTHEGASHRLDGWPRWPDAQRHVLADWQAAADGTLARGDLLWLDARGITRRPVAELLATRPAAARARPS